MKDLIKAIRFAANMNQEQFASALGTTPLSINRWENGKTLPNRMAQTQLYNCVCAIRLGRVLPFSHRLIESGVVPRADANCS